MLPKLFRIDCADQPEQVKVTIKEALSDWFDPREFPRGWIAGPVICLWRTAMTNDNIVYAVILRDGWRTRIIGFTLSQFARSFFIFALLGAIIWLIASTVQGDLFLIGTLPLAILCGAALAVLIFWPESSQEDRTVTFLREVVEGQTRKPRLQPAFTRPATYGEARALELVVSGRSVASLATAEAVIAAFRAMDDGEEEFLILAAGENEFFQSAPGPDEFFVEWRDGCRERHFVAQCAGSEGKPLAMQDALRLALDFLHGAEWSENAEWVKLYR